MPASGRDTQYEGCWQTSRGTARLNDQKFSDRIRPTNYNFRTFDFALLTWMRKQRKIMSSSFSDSRISWWVFLLIKWIWHDQDYFHLLNIELHFDYGELRGQSWSVMKVRYEDNILLIRIFKPIRLIGLTNLIRLMIIGCVLYFINCLVLTLLDIWPLKKDDHSQSL
jgi:hypothetical protein